MVVITVIFNTMVSVLFKAYMTKCAGAAVTEFDLVPNNFIDKYRHTVTHTPHADTKAG